MRARGTIDLYVVAQALAELDITLSPRELPRPSSPSSDADPLSGLAASPPQDLAAAFPLRSLCRRHVDPHRVENDPDIGEPVGNRVALLSKIDDFRRQFVRSDSSMTRVATSRGYSRRRLSDHGRDDPADYSHRARQVETTGFR